jgi:hypothetical protein
VRRSGAERRRVRRGVALVAALALLALSAAVLAGSFAAATAATRAMRAARAAAEAEATARHALATILSQGDAETEGLAVGAWRERALSDVELDGGARGVTGRTHVQRLQPRLYALAVDVRIGTGAVLARRRLRLLLERPSGDSSTTLAGGALRPIARWSTADLY